MNQTELFKTKSTPSTKPPQQQKQKEEMVEIPVLGEIDSATGKITWYNNKKGVPALDKSS